MIIPGVSGGTVAVLLNVYDELIDSFNGLKKRFVASISFLIPVLLGAVLAFAAAYFPLKFALERAPLPTVLLFAGLMLGSVPKLFTDCKGAGFKRTDVAAIALPFLAIIGVCVLKLYVSAGDADLSTTMPAWGWAVVFFVAAAASCALIVPGVSGSMLLMILGYYEPILGLISGLMSNFWHAAGVLAVFAAGLLAGFFSIAKLMKFFLNKFPRGTHWAIFGFVLGSLPAIFIVFDYSVRPDAIQIGVGVALCVVGALGTFLLTKYAEKVAARAVEKRGEIPKNGVENNPADTQDGEDKD